MTRRHTPPPPGAVRALAHGRGRGRPAALLHEDPAGGGAVWPALLVTLRRSHTTGMKSKVHPTYKTKYLCGELAGLQPGPRSPRRCDGVGVLGSDHGLDAPPKRPAGWAAAVLGSRHRARSDPAACLPSPAAPGRRVPVRPVRDDAPRPLRPRRYDAFPAQSAFEAPSAIAGLARRGPPSRARQHGSVPRRGR